MTEPDYCDYTWEEFFGPSQELMPSIMGAFDAIISTKLNEKEARELKLNNHNHKRTTKNFANLSPCVQKILSNVSDQEISQKFNSEDTNRRNFNNNNNHHHRLSFRLVNSDKNLHKSNENLEIISSNVQKMLSNFQDSELVLAPNANRLLVRNNSVLHRKEFLHKIEFNMNNNNESSFVSYCDNCDDSGAEQLDGYCQKPLGSYLHSPQGIASRTPVGRKNLGKYLQVPSESSVGTTTSSTLSSEVSRPVSLTSLGSCSSSGSSNGHHQPGSAYLASAESLDSDPEPTGSQESADSGIAEQPSISPELRVLQEVLNTETIYVADLNEVIQGYLEPWRNDSECPLAEFLKSLFSNIEAIYKVNKSFLEDLEKANCDPTKTANVFLQHDNGFTIYTEYCTNYPRTMDVLSQLTRDEKMAQLFREKQLQLGHALPLGSYLLKPVQRILKYHLLLQRLSKQCEAHHRPAVDLALTTMTGIAFDINNMKRKHEHAVRVQEIQSQLYGWTGPDLTALGELIAEGTFRVMNARGRRHVFLFEKVLLLAKSKQDGALAYKSHIMCNNLMLVEQVRGEPLSFHVLPFDNPRLQCTLRARSPHHKRDWTLQIKRVILENYSAVIPSHARQLVMELGQDLHESENTTDKWSPLKQHSTPHYLERRSRVRKTRDLSNRRASSQDSPFASLGSWRRKSEPNMIPQYTTKTVPKKISKIKKAKEVSGSSTFYTDLSDSEVCCDTVNQSMESLPQTLTESKLDLEVEMSKKTEESDDKVVNVEKIVSELMMQNPDYQKILKRQEKRRNNASEPGPSSWFEEKSKLFSKADSLPRSFQLNDRSDAAECHNERLILDMSLKENIDGEEQHENDLSSQIEDNSEHPEHKIYRKSPIRLSLLQRFRHMISDDQKSSQKYPLHKQGSKSMGEKIAHPDYADPQKLFPSSRNSSQVNLHNDVDLMGEREQLDMSINEKDVLNEFEKRLNEKSSHNNSSQNSDCYYYESLLDKVLIEEYDKDEHGRLVAKQDSFNNRPQKPARVAKDIKKPTKAPPPIPVKPSRLVRSSSEAAKRKNVVKTTSCNQLESANHGSTSWVKAMVGRFE